MSVSFMLAIAVMYLGAALSYAIEGKIEWCVVSVCWGAGNAVLALVSR